RGPISPPRRSSRAPSTITGAACSVAAPPPNPPLNPPPPSPTCRCRRPHRNDAMRLILPLFIALCVTAVAGCAAPKPTPTPAPAASPRAPAASTIPTRNTDPCAMRLHEAAGALLLYYATHHELPPNVEA